MYIFPTQGTAAAVPESSPTEQVEPAGEEPAPTQVMLYYIIVGYIILYYIMIVMIIVIIMLIMIIPTFILQCTRRSLPASSPPRRRGRQPQPLSPLLRSRWSMLAKRLPRRRLCYIMTHYNTHNML